MQTACVYHHLMFTANMSREPSACHTGHLAPRGLQNDGNYCYVNSVAQALLGDPALVRAVKSLTPEARHAGPVTQATYKLVQQLSRPGSQPLLARGYLEFIGCKYGQQHLREQQDAHHFLSDLLYGLMEEAEGKQLSNAVKRGYFGQIIYEVSRKNNISSNLQDTIGFSLDVEISKVTTIDQLLVNFFRAEEISPNLFQKAYIKKLPETLILHMKFFKYDALRGAIKIGQHFEVPSKMQLKKEWIQNDSYTSEDLTYRLVAVVYHSGERISSGHYTTVGFNMKFHKWFSFNDNTAFPIDAENFKHFEGSRTPYLLVYRQVKWLADINIPPIKGNFSDRQVHNSRIMKVQDDIWNNMFPPMPKRKPKQKRRAGKNA